MQWLTTRTVTLMTASFFALALVQSEPSALLVAATVTLAMGALFAARVIFAPDARELGVGSRARAHREPLRALPEPQHPDTDGRPRSRAPSLVVSATALSAF